MKVSCFQTNWTSVNLCVTQTAWEKNVSYKKLSILAFKEEHGKKEGRGRQRLYVWVPDSIEELIAIWINCTPSQETCTFFIVTKVSRRYSHKSQDGSYISAIKSPSIFLYHVSWPHHILPWGLFGVFLAKQTLLFLST